MRGDPRQGPYHDIFAVLVGGKMANQLYHERVAHHDLAEALCKYGYECFAVPIWAQDEAANIIFKHGHRVARGLAKSLWHTYLRQ